MKLTVFVVCSCGREIVVSTRRVDEVKTVILAVDVQRLLVLMVFFVIFISITIDTMI